MMKPRRAPPPSSGKEKYAGTVAGARKQEGKRQKTPAFLYLVPLVPFLVLFLMSGKPATPGDVGDVSSFMPPQAEGGSTGQGQGVRAEQQAQQLNKADETDSLSKMLGQQNSPEESTSQNEKQVESTTMSTPQYKIVQRSEQLVKSPHTIVSAYFVVKSKSDKSEYLKWMQNFLSVQDPMIIFTSEGEMVDTIFGFRQHALNRTLILTMPLDQVEMATKFDVTFWKAQFDQDPEKRVHRGFQLFWIWLSKTYFVTQAIDFNPFSSDLFMWSDIGCFRRNQNYNDKLLIAHPEMVPKDKVLSMAHHEPKPPPYVWWNDKINQKVFFYHSGSQMVAYQNVWKEFHSEFWKTVYGFQARTMFVGEDQCILQSTCLRRHDLCAYVPMDQVKHDNHYFGLRYVLHNGGDYTYWYPPSDLPQDKSDVKDFKLLEKMPDPPPPDRSKIRLA